MERTTDPANLNMLLQMEIQARKSAEEALTLYEERYRLVVEKALEGILVAQDGCLRLVNAAACTISGYSEKELVAKPFTEFIHPDDQEMVLLRHRRRIAGEEFESRYSFRIVTKGNQTRWVEIDSVMITWEGRPAALFFMTDVTDRRMVEESLKLSEEKFSKAFQASPDAIIISRASDGCIVDINEGFVRLSGYTREEALNNSTVGLGLWEDPRDRDLVVGLLKDRKSIRDQIFRFRTKDGSAVIGLYSGEIILIGQEPHILSVVRDITGMQQAQQELKRSEQRYRAVLESSPDPIVVYDSEGCVTYINPAFARVFGWSLPEIQGKHIDFVPDKEITRTEETLRRLYDGEAVPSFDTLRRTKDGRILDIHISAALMRDPNGRPSGNVVTLRDITERKSAERALQQSEEGKRVLIEGSPIGIGMIQDGKYVYANKALAQMMAYKDAEDLVGCSPLDLIAPEDRELVRQRGKARAHDLPVPLSYQVRGLKQTGEVFDISIRPRRTDYMGRPALLTFVLDVTEENRLKAQLVQSHKMEAVGTLAGGIAHDFNNVLQVILGYAQLLQGKQQPNTQEHNHVARIAAAARGGAELIRQLMAFSRKASIRPQALDLNQQVNQVCDMLRHTIPKMIHIRLELADDLPVMYADPIQIEQILMNLSVNARDAMKEGGMLTIRTEAVLLDTGFCRDHIGAQEGQYVMLVVEDTGHGMDNSTLDHIFEPFYTTKEVGKGTGLGLSMVYGIVKQNNGYITCSSEVGKGTVFRIYFPVLEKYFEQAFQVETSIAKGKGETVLMVDDEEPLLDLASDFLVNRGYRVLTAKNGLEALAVHAKHHSHIQLVVLDLIMPEMGGRRCLPQLRTLNPHLKILVVTGHTSGGVISEALALGATDFLPKPYDMSQLLTKIREILDSN
jgi:PAS domain S-box-containing protein